MIYNHSSNMGNKCTSEFLNPLKQLKLLGAKNLPMSISVTDFIIYIYSFYSFCYFYNLKSDYLIDSYCWISGNSKSFAPL